MNLKSLENTYKNCKFCSELVKNRSQVVFGVGNPETCKVVIIGEAPGKQEDLKGEPFVGRSGKILDEFLESIGLSRSKDVYITNTVLCRPPDNRNPSSIELKNCRPRLNEHIKILNPKVVITLGNFATKYMLKTKQGITSLRGTPVEMDFNGRSIVVLPVQHPAVLLYNGNSPVKRAEFEADFAVIKKILASGS